MRYLLVESKIAIIDTLLAEMFGPLQYRKGRPKTPRAACLLAARAFTSSFASASGEDTCLPGRPDIG